MMQPCLIALDWGTTSLRAYLMARDGTILRRQDGGRGIMQIDNGRFDAALQEIAGAWLRDFPGLPLIASGMVGSKQGWREAPYCACPASVDAIASRIVVLEFGNGRRLHIVPGLSCTDAISGVPDVMRGEETQIIGAVPDQGEHLVILPGTHSKWAKVVDGTIMAFSTWMTGEVYAALTQYTLLGSPQLVRSYLAALGIAGMSSVEGTADCAASGLLALAGKARLL